LAQIRFSVGYLRRKSAFYVVPWRKFPEQKPTCARKMWENAITGFFISQ